MPIPIGVAVHWSEDGVANPLPQKVEVSFNINESGEPPVWEDVTDRISAWGALPEHPGPAELVTKNYIWRDMNPEPLGIHARVTFADGAIIESSAASSPKVKVLPDPNPWSVPDERYIVPISMVKDGAVFVDRWELPGTRTGTAPLTAGYFIVSGQLNYDFEKPKQYFIDWGEGAGWQEATAEAQHWDQNGDDPVTDGEISAHSYLVPGSYTVRTAIQFWDGEFVVNDESEDSLIVVTAN